MVRHLGTLGGMIAEWVDDIIPESAGGCSAVFFRMQLFSAFSLSFAS